MRTQFNNVIEELEIEMGDIQFRRNIKGMNKYYLPFVLLEMKDFFRINKGLLRNGGWLSEPSYSGNIYEYVYVSKYSRYIKGSDKYDFPSFNLIKNEIVKDDRTRRWFESFFKFSLDEDKWEYNWRSDNLRPNRLVGWENFRKTEYHTPDYYIKTYKVRKIIKRFNYESPIIRKKSIFRIKYWDKETKKTNNKGLTATKYNDGDLRYDDYLEAYTIEKWAVENGFKKEKNKKYYYGHYAEFLLKI